MKNDLLSGVTVALALVSIITVVEDLAIAVMIGVIIDFHYSRVHDHSGIEAINSLAERYSKLG